MDRFLKFLNKGHALRWLGVSESLTVAKPMKLSFAPLPNARNSATGINR